MRAIALLTSAVLAAALAAPALAAWKEYPYADLGFVVQFPDAPMAGSGTYKTGLVDTAKVHIYGLKQENALYVASVVDLQDRAGDGASLMTEAEVSLGLLGDIKANATSRVEPGKAAVFGRFITIDCRKGRIGEQPGTPEAAQIWFKDISGTECPDGARLTVNMFFHRGRLYLIQGINLPAKDGNAAGPAALRFANSISFFAPDGSRNPVDLLE